jgi:hypothetical protein
LDNIHFEFELFSINLQNESMGGMSCFSACSQHEIPKHKCFNAILVDEEMPLHWKWSAIILLPKQGSEDDLNTSRPIILLPNVCNISSKVLTRKLCQIPDENQPPKQAVFHCVFITTEYVLP